MEVEELEAPEEVALLEDFTASRSSGVVRPNFEESPPDFSHFPEPRDWSLMRTPMSGRRPSPSSDG